ncbi:MAG: CHAD domain-containing protein [Acidobacteria bacterium]|nr:CHAD domain-containing protein [Acidobacteriota bacterium]
MTASETAYPVRTLREHVSALEAAMMICLARPKPRAVHRLRTTTRRIEGQFALLGIVRDVPLYDEHLAKTRRSLGKIRRAAGSVRDLDVQQELIGSVASTSRSESLQHDAARLRTDIGEMRKDHAARLQKLLHRRAAGLTARLENLLETLEPVESSALAPAELATLARGWFQRNAPAAPTGSSGDDPEYLHAVRKTAKLARYIAENAPRGAAVARELARSFEELQQAGGEWHDWLVLAALADKRLGTASPLTKIFAQRCRLSLAAYKKRVSRGVA